MKTPVNCIAVIPVPHGKEVGFPWEEVPMNAALKIKAVQLPCKYLINLNEFIAKFVRN